MTTRSPSESVIPPEAMADNTTTTVPVDVAIVVREADGVQRMADVRGAVTIQAGLPDLRRLEVILREDDVTVSAGAYEIACEDLAAWQAKRHHLGLPATTEGSLCDGLGSVLDYVESLEAQLGIKGTRRLPKRARPSLPKRAQRVSDDQLMRLMRAAGVRFQATTGKKIDSTAGSQPLDVMLQAARLIAAAASSPDEPAPTAPAHE